MSSELEQRPFGRTGEKVSVIGLGGAALYKHSYELGVATVKHALDLGVTYFDTSPAYGQRSPDGRWLAGGISQLIMGEELDGTTRPHLLATKLINYTTEATGFISRSPAVTVPIRYRTVEDCRAQLQDNLRALRRDRVDVLLGHTPSSRRPGYPTLGMTASFWTSIRSTTSRTQPSCRRFVKQRGKGCAATLVSV